MKELKYICTLETDVVLSVSSATEGEQQTLDFIPGNNFLGVVASTLYDELDAHESWLLFHSGKVRFGDAHPLMDGCRSLRIPADLYYPKLKTPADGCYVYSRLPQQWDEALRHLQLKQCRSGFYILQTDKVATEVPVKKNFAIKSAYDRVRRCSMDAMMYGYESLGAGLDFAFSIEMDDDIPQALAEKLNHALIGRRHIGRSRTAQYGMVRILSSEFDEPSSMKPSGEEWAIYADGRLIFHDEESGLPTLRPKASQFGLPEGSEVVWHKSQVRTFRYAPWNARRQAFDTDRMGFEKGSVFIVRSPKAQIPSSRYVGSYHSEGFGRVVYNPPFLEADAHGKAVYRFMKRTEDNRYSLPQSKVDACSSPLLGYLKRCQQEDVRKETVYKEVNAFVEKYRDRFKGRTFVSQWGTIRSIAHAHADGKELLRQLFHGEKAYLKHGVAKEKWEEKGRLYVFEEFCLRQSAEDLQLVLVNLASEMAKNAE